MTNEDRLGVNDGNSKRLAVQALSFAQQIINGFVAGSACALFALGFALMFGVLGVVNLTYGFYFSAGAYIALFATLKGASHARPALIRPSLRAAFSRLREKESTGRADAIRISVRAIFAIVAGGGEIGA